MAECARRKQKKKKHQEDERHSSPETEHVGFGDKDILKYLIAAQSDDVETLQQFLQCGMAVDTKCLMFLDTALHKACRTGSTKAVHLLLDWGADIHMKTDDGYSVLHIAVKNRQANIVQLLLSRGVSPDTMNEHDGVTPLMLAASMSNTIILGQLISSGCGLDHQDMLGMCALHHCFSYYQERVEFAMRTVDCVQLLVEAGANILLRDVQGRYPLTRALEKTNMRAVKYLLTHNAEPDRQLLLYPPCQRLTPLAYAVETRRHPLMYMLWHAGACWEGTAACDIAESAPRHIHLTAVPFSQPRTLKEACRKSIRDQLRLCGAAGCKFGNSVEELLIPKPLREFILMKEVLSQ